ncbi:MAG: type II toxin-antitoxin system RelB/DinJ family antitoxin [Schwartzia sp.]|nr:type II toxin-antitoxin system RelB/DinJ family antitoxin [Schwartzia sp. (in: firmicutes)]
MATSTLQVRIDADLKKEAETALKSMGLSMSTAIHLFCRQVVNHGRIPFDIIASPSLNETTRRAMDDTLNGKNLSRKFSSIDEMWEDLNA